MSENKMNIYQKMLKIQSELGTVAKNLDVMDYKAVSERDIIDAVKPLEEKYGVFSYPVSRSVVDAGTMDFETKKGLRKNLYMRVETVYRFVNVDDPTEYLEVFSYGDGLDTADKSVGKAMTYADKYALMKAYKISTGDDPDAINSSEYGDAKSDAKHVGTASEPQLNYVKKLYTQEQIDIMLKKLGYESIEQISKEEASTMIKARAK